MSFHGPNNAPVSTSAFRLPAQEKNAPEGCLLKESDEDLFTVPDLEAAPSSSRVAALTQQNSSSVTGGTSTEAGGPVKVRRGRNPQDREYRRHKRLLRNRVSAQEARERKKIYVNDLESRAKELQDMNAKLEEKISTLINENAMLRKVLVNMRPKVDESSGPQNEQLATTNQ